MKTDGIPSKASPFSASLPHSKNHRALRLASTLLLSASLLLAPSCESDHNALDNGDGMAVELSIRTRAITSNSETYEVGSIWENYIDIAGGDYKIYFFTYDPISTSDENTNNTLITVFQPTEINAVESDSYTKYTLSGKTGDDITEYSNFKIVVLANWGNHPEVTAGETTIDNLVEGGNTTFLAETFLTSYGVDSSWESDFVEDLHLVGGSNNSTDEATTAFNRQSDTANDTWSVYLPEYDNTRNDAEYSYIQVEIDGEIYEIYFAYYSNGESSSTADYDIFRNYIYRFNITYTGRHLYVSVVNWNVLDEETLLGDDWWLSPVMNFLKLLFLFKNFSLLLYKLTLSFCGIFFVLKNEISLK